MALGKLASITALEDGLDGLGFDPYLDFEIKGGDPGRIQCLFERAVTADCLNVQTWLRFLKWLDNSLKIPNVCVSLLL